MAYMFLELLEDVVDFSSGHVLFVLHLLESDLAVKVADEPGYHDHGGRAVCQLTPRRDRWEPERTVYVLLEPSDFGFWHAVTDRVQPCSFL